MVCRLVTALVLASSLAPGCGDSRERAAREADPRLNVVLVTLDTTRADALGAYGQPLEVTPRLDALAAEGLLFEQVVSSSPSTLPSHATLLTGQQPYAHGVRANAGYALADATVTLAEVLREHGWQTGAEVSASVLGSFQRLDQGFDLYRDPLARAEGAADAPTIRRGGDVTLHGMAFLRENRHRPFFLWLHYYDPHQPFTPPPRFAELLPGEPYLAEVRFADHQVGRIVDEIEHLGLRDQTLVVVASDHGEGLGEHDEQTHTFFVYDSTMRVPLLFWGPALVPHARVPTLVRLVDVTPTLLDLLGLPPLPDAQGVSLAPLFADPRADLALTGYGESFAPLALFGCDVLRFSREGRWKYIHKLEPELYDVLADPGERSNLAAQRPEEVDHLRSRLEALLSASTGPGDATEARLGPETLAQLRALGYLSGRPLDPQRGESLALRGPDPNSRARDLREASQAWEAFQAGRNEEAVRGFRGVYQRNPESVPVIEGLAGALARSDDHGDEVVALLRRGLELDPGSSNLRTLLAFSLRKQGRVREAEALLRETLALDRCSVEASVQLTAILAARGAHEERQKIVRAAESCPQTEAARRALHRWD